MYTKEKLQRILENWDAVDGLAVSDVYILNGAKLAPNTWMVGTDYVLKTDEREKLLTNIKVTKALHGQGFAASIPVPTTTGSDYLEDRTIFVLSRKLKGNPLPSSDRFGKNMADFAKEYGESIARLHKALKAIQKDIPRYEVNQCQRVTEWALPKVRQQNVQWRMGIDPDFFEDYIGTFGELYDNLPKQLIHRDPNPGNILFLNAKVSGFIDFDLTGIDIRLWDVCYCATSILSEANEGTWGEWFDLLGGILRGYDAENKLSAEEKQAVFYVICAIQMICVAFFGGSDQHEDLAQTNRRMMSFVVQNREAIDAVFVGTVNCFV